MIVKQGFIDQDLVPLPETFATVSVLLVNITREDCENASVLSVGDGALESKCATKL